MCFRKIFTTLFLLSAVFSVFPEDFSNLAGNELSKSINKALSQNGFSAFEQKLSETGQDEFAFNLILNFTQASETDRTTLSSPSSSQERNEVIFCFYQEDFFKNESAILDFLTFLKTTPLSWNATVLFSALDNLPYITEDSVNGTEIFAADIDNPQNAVAVAINLDEKRKTAVYTGSRKSTSPLYLTQRMTDAFFETGTDFSFEDKFSAIYRLGIVKGQKRLTTFLNNEIPAIEVNFSSVNELPVLKKFTENYTPEGTSEWDMHYLYLSRANLFKAFFVSERTIIITCLSVGILTILILCLFSFTGKGGERQKYEFIRSSYMIPITIGISFLSLISGQHLVLFVSKILPLNPVFQFGIKIVFSMIFISILFAVLEILKFSVTAFVYGYILSIVAIFNIFLFSTRDLTLFVIFALEYIIIYISRPVRKLPVLIVFFSLMTIPFLPYAYIIIKSADEAELFSSVIASTSGNLILAFGILPFQIMWLKILMFMNIYAGGKGYSMKRIIINDVISTAEILGFCFAIILSISHFIYRPDYRKSQKIETKIINSEKICLETTLSKDSFSGMNTNHITISSDENALRYEVALSGLEMEHPVYDSVYDYTIKKDKNGNDFYFFLIPDYPPKKITIDYAAEMSAKARIEIKAFYKTEDAHTFRCEKRELLVE
ncbi:MAG: hypothetical protein II821_09010 [Treponema sp.]|nr:hypothetical protein [Treponema sp.]